MADAIIIPRSWGSAFSKNLYYNCLFPLLLRLLWWSLGLTFSSSYSERHLEVALQTTRGALGCSGLYWGLLRLAFCFQAVLGPGCFKLSFLFRFSILKIRRRMKVTSKFSIVFWILPKRQQIQALEQLAGLSGQG